jgi:hypothetical protein
MREVKDGHRLLDVFPNAVDSWDGDKNIVDIKGLSFGCHNDVWWKCQRGHSFRRSVKRFVDSKGVCPECSKRGRISLREIRIYCELKTFFDDVILDYSFGGHLRVDMYIPSIRTVVEYDGCYWHKDREKKDVEKTERLKDRGVRVIRVRETPLLPLMEDDVVCDFRNLLDACRNVVRKVGGSIDGYESFLGGDIYERTVSRIYSGIVLNNLHDRFPILCEEWDYSKNLFGPKSVSYASGRTVSWKCSRGHSWRTAVCNRSLRGSGCPKCSNNQVTKSNNLAVSYPEIAAEWDHERNKVSPADVSWSQPVEAWWICAKCACSWKQQIISRIRYRNRKFHGCPECKRRKELGVRSFKIEHPEIAAEWDYDKNIDKPENVFSSENIMIWWRCEKGHSWKGHLGMRVKRRSGCPYCRREKCE